MCPNLKTFIVDFSIYHSLKPYSLDFMIKNMFALLNCKARQFIMLLQSLLLCWNWIIEQKWEKKQRRKKKKFFFILHSHDITKLNTKFVLFNFPSNFQNFFNKVRIHLPYNFIKRWKKENVCFYWLHSVIRNIAKEIWFTHFLTKCL